MVLSLAGQNVTENRDASKPTAVIWLGEHVERLGFDVASRELVAQRSLQRRADTKFLFGIDQLREILAERVDDFALVQASGASLANYGNLYFDTATHGCLYDHHRGRRDRYKVRVRHHVDRQLSSLEVKRKTRADLTEKVRTPLAFGQEAFGREHSDFIQRNSPMGLETLQPALRVDFCRLTLVGKEHEERATFDVWLRFGGRGRHVHLPDRLVVCEIKQPKFWARSPLMMALRGHRLRPFRMSKYCAAASFLLPHLKLNRFRPFARAIDRAAAS